MAKLPFSTLATPHSALSTDYIVHFYCCGAVAPTRQTARSSAFWSRLPIESRPGSRQSEGARRNKMSVVVLHLARLYSMAKAGLALVGLAAVGGFMLIPVDRSWRVESYPGLPGEALSEGSSAATGPITPGIVETAQSSASSGRSPSSSPGAVASPKAPSPASSPSPTAPDAAFGRPFADPRGDGGRVALQPGGRKHRRRQRPDAGAPEVPPGQAGGPRRRERRCSIRTSTSRSARRSCASTCAASATPRPRYSSTPAPSTSRTPITPIRCSWSDRAARCAARQARPRRREAGQSPMRWRLRAGPACCEYRQSAGNARCRSRRSRPREWQPPPPRSSRPSAKRLASRSRVEQSA